MSAGSASGFSIFAPHFRIKLPNFSLRQLFRRGATPEHRDASKERYSPPDQSSSALGLLSALGAAPFAARALRGGVAYAAPTQIVDGRACVLTPALTEGPYFVDERLNRSDLTSGTTNTGVVNGLPLTLNLSLNSIKGTGCRPISGVQVDVWRERHRSIFG